MFKHLQKLLLFAALCVPWAMQSQVSLPYSTGFESGEDDSWTIVNDATNGWYIGTAAHHTGSMGLYISDNSGTSNAYTNSTTQFSYAYRDIQVTNAGQIAISFDWLANGEGNYDFLRAWLAPATATLTAGADPEGGTSAYSYRESTPAGWTDLGGKMNLQSSWQTTVATANVTAGTYRLVFMWANDASGGSTPPAAIDNVIVTELSCPQPTALSVIPSADQLDISWTAGGDETEWKVTVSDTIIDFVTTNSYTATNLESNTIYSVKVYAICGVDDTSMATSGNYRTSCTAISQLPYSNDFENEPHYSATTYAAAFPNCWTRINDATGSNNYYPYLYASSSYAHSGSTGMYWYQSSTSGYAQNEYAILPPIDLDVYEISDLTLSFYAKTTSTSYHPAPIIGVMSNPNDVTTFTPVYTFSTTAITTSWQLFAISLSSYTGTGAYIAIKWPNPNTSSYMAIDDIFLTDEWCDIPGNVVVNPATDEVTISWEPNGGSSFTVFLGEDTIVNVTDTFYVFSNLTPNTVFNYGVATECSNGNSAFIAGSVTTLCGMITTLPFTENFDAAATGSSSSASFVNCLTRLNNGTSYFGYPYVGGSTYNHTPGGSKGLYWYNTTTTGTYGDYQIVVMPGVDTNVYPIRNLQLHFWSRPNSTSYSPQFQVGVMTNPNDASSFVQVGTVNVANTTTWQEFIVPLGTYTGEGQFIALRALRPTSSWYAYVDDITIETQPTCPGVTGMEVNATVGNALVSWNVRTGAPGEAESFNIVVKDEQGNTSNYTTSDMNYMITGLAAGGAYTVYVNADCGSDGEGSADSISFVTASLNCIALDPTTADTAIIAGSSSSTSYYIPIGNYYNYSYTQQLILASELNGPTTFTGIDFQYGYSSAVTAKGNVTIYMANVSATSLSSNFVPYSSSFVPVYSGNMNVTQGWNHFEFTTPFTYDGSSTLLIAVHDNSGDYDGSSYVYNTHSASGKARYIQNDSDPYDIATVSGGTSLNDRANMKLYSGECDQVAECAAPYLEVSEVLADEVTLIWIPGYDETSWNIDYREAGTTSWNSAATGISTTSYTISGLNPATDYEFRVYFECSDNETYAANVIVSTLCNETALPYIQGFENVTTSTSSTNYGVMPNCWDYVLTGTGSYITGSYLPGVYYSSTYSNTGNYCLRLAGKGYFMLPPMATSLDSVMLTMNCYITSSSYGIEVGVMEANGTFVSIAQPTLTTSQHTPIEVSFANYSGNSRVIALHNYYSTYDYSYVYVDDIVVDYIPDCARITGVSVNNIGQYDATIHWTAGNSGDYEVVYGLSGFAPADSVAIVVNDVDSVDITNLSPNTAYDVYVREICNGGGYGAWSFSYTFRTECGPITVLPFMESFEAYPVGSSTAPVYEIPCWGRLDNAGQNHFGYVNSASSWSAGPHTGDKFIYYYIPTNTGTHADWIITILPPIDTNVYPMNTLQTSFWVRMNSASTSSFIEVGVISDVTDETTFVPVDTIAVAGDVHTLKTAYLSSFTGYGDHIAYKFHRAAEAHYFFIDDVTIEVIPDCPPVSNIDVVTFDDESITLNWTENGNATSWSIEYGEHGFTLGSGTTVSTTSVPYTINNLNTNTAYDFYISPDCSSGVAGVTMGTYRTACGAITVLPYIENFDGMTGSTATSPVPQGFQPNCWDFYNDGTRSNYQYSPYVYNSSTYAHSGNNCIRFYSYNSSGDSNQYLILPIIDSNAYEVSDLQVSFWVRGNSTSSSYRADVVVGIMTDIYDESSFIPYDTVLCASTTYSYHEVMFSQWTGANGRITLLFPKPLTSSSYEYGYLDDVTVEPIPDCPQVSNITLAGLDSNWLSVSWVENGNATSWNIEYGLHGFTLGNGTTTVATSIPFTISGLSPNTDYDVYITPVCTDGTAATRMGTFRTANVYLQLPFACGFEDSVQNLVWVLENGSNTNKWYIGSGTNNGGSNALYVSDNNGTSCNYTISSSTMVFAYADVMINTPGDYNYSFDWKSYGESTLDYIRAALVPVSETLTAGTSVPSGFSSSALPSGWIALDGGQKLNLQSAWQTRSDFVTVPSAGVYHLVFAFRCDGSVGTQPPAAIDNVVFIANTCSAPANLHSTANTATTIDLAWNANSNAAEFLVSYGNSPLSDPMNGTVTSVTTNSFSATGLGNLDYYFYVRTVCTNGDSSLWIPIGPIHPGSWNMRANMTDTLYMCGGVIYDDGGPSGDYAMSQNSYIILYPDAPNNIVSINGTATIEGNSYDKLFIYDGVGTSGTQLVGLQGTSYSGGTTVSATSTSGPLTIYFTSDGSVTYSGFVLNVSCISSTCMVSNLALDATVPESATQLALTWDNNGALLYEIEYGTGAFTPGFGMGNVRVLILVRGHMLCSRQ